MVLVDSIVNACIELYKKFPKTGKPNSNEWTVISSIIGVFNDSEIKVLSMGTGSKCVGKSSMSPKGDVINDSHAEVIARRAFIKYLFLEIINCNVGKSSQVLYLNEQDDSFCVRDSVKFYFVTSMSPCGDASIMPKVESLGEDLESHGMLVNISKNTLKRSNSTTNINTKKLKTGNSDEICDDSLSSSGTLQIDDIHRTGAKCLPHSSIQDPHLPGVLYHNTGAVRTKPGRGDPTVSVSCSDKIAKWNFVGWQGALLSFFIKSPLFMEAIICGGGCPFSEESFNRAVNERINRQTFIPIHRSEVIFPDIKTKEKKPNPSSIIWCCSDEERTEVSINGRKQGVTKKNYNKKSARSSICKKELFILFEKAVNTLCKREMFLKRVFDNPDKTLNDITYGELKLKSLEYQKRWKVVRDECFKVWSNKPFDLLNFTLNDEKE